MAASLECPLHFIVRPWITGGAGWKSLRENDEMRDAERKDEKGFVITGYPLKISTY